MHDDRFGGLAQQPILPRTGVIRTPWWLWVVTACLLGLVIVLQRPETGPPENQSQLVDGSAKITAPTSSELILMGKLGLAMNGLFAGMPGAGTGGPSDPQVMMRSFADQMAGWLSADPSIPVSASNPPIEQKNPTSAAQRFRATIVGGLLGLPPEELAWRFQDVEDDLSSSSELHGDLRVARALLGVGPGRPATDESAAFDESAPADDAPRPSAPSARTPSQSELDGFRARHGWFAEVAENLNTPSAPVITRAQSEGVLVLVIFVLAFAIVGCAALVGAVLLIVGMVQYFSARNGRFWRMPRPVAATEWPEGEDAASTPDMRSTSLAPGSVWLETFAVFLAAFLGVKLAQAGLVLIFGPDAAWLPTAAIGLQWLVLPSIFWPMVRGMTFRQWCSGMGWHRGQGVGRELGLGLAGYLAFLPLYFLLAVVVVMVTLIIQQLMGEPQQAPSNRVLELVQGGGVIEMVMIYLLATIWAPVVEESIFRGALYRFLRGRASMLVAVGVTAAVFAALHGYLVLQLVMVGSLGVWFAILRQWRDSLLAPVLGHAIHNGFVLALVLAVTQFMRP